MNTTTTRTNQQTAQPSDFDRRAQKVAAIFLAVMAVVALYAFLAVAGIVPAAPWSPIGKAQ